MAQEEAAAIVQGPFSEKENSARVSNIPGAFQPGGHALPPLFPKTSLQLSPAR